MLANNVDIMDVVVVILSVIKVMQSFSVSLGAFSFTLWDLIVSLGVLETIAFIFGAYFRRLPKD